jgi:polyhydroxybutyrate depolymerase
LPFLDSLLRDFESGRRIDGAQEAPVKKVMTAGLGTVWLLGIVAACGSGGGASSGTPPVGGAPGGEQEGVANNGSQDATAPGSGDGDTGGSTAGTGLDAGTTPPVAMTDGGSLVAEGGSSAPIVCPTSPLQPGNTSASLQVGGVMRDYILHVPTGYTGKTPVPLVLDFHPILADDSYELMNSGYANLADTEGFVVAFPDGIDNAWNIGPCCTTSRTVDDLGFAKSLVTALEGQACVDPKRVYAVGYSMGGGMSHYLGCNAADVFAAIAPAAFDLLEESEEPCHPSRPITEISFRGTADPIVPYDGGASMPPNGLDVTIHFLGAVGTFQKWAQLDGCTGSPSAPDSNGCSTYSQCQAGVEATLCTTQGGGHVTGNPQIGWAMLKAHPMP